MESWEGADGEQAGLGNRTDARRLLVEARGGHHWCSCPPPSVSVRLGAEAVCMVRMARQEGRKLEARSRGCSNEAPPSLAVVTIVWLRLNVSCAPFSSTRHLISAISTRSLQSGALEIPRYLDSTVSTTLDYLVVVWHTVVCHQRAKLLFYI